MNRIERGILGVLLVGLLVYALIGTRATFRDDDFGQFTIAYEQGIVGAAVWRYNNWTARYSQAFVSSALYLAFGETAAKVNPTLTLIALVGGFYSLSAAFSQRPLLISLAITHVLLLGVDLWDTLYWIPGAVTYLLPVALTTLLFGWLLHLSPPFSWRGFRKPLG